MPPSNLGTTSSPMPVRFVRNGFRYDTRLTAMMVEDMLFNPVLAARVILNVELPPHQELRLLTMWTHYFTLDDSGFSTGKTHTAAVVMSLRSCLIPGRISGVLSGTFRQGKLIFQYLDRWAATSKIFRSCLKMTRNQPRLVHGQDAYEAFFRGLSQIRVLPPNFMNDSERLRSERWHDEYLDEWTTYHNFNALTTTIFGRATGVNHFQDCPVRQNHIHCFSTPNYQHHPAYELVRQIDKTIESGDKNYAHFTSNYRHVPDTKQWRPLVDRKTIFLMQTTSAPGRAGAEIDGLWQKESQAYYSSLRIQNIRSDSSVPYLARALGTDIYFAGIDCARGHGDNGRVEGDDFCVTVWRVPGGKGKPYPCHVVRRNNIRADQMSAIVHELHRAFHFTWIVYDPGGGGMFMRDELVKIRQLIRGEEVFVSPLCDFGARDGVIGDSILIPFRRTSFHIKMLWGTMASDSVLTNRMHEIMKRSIENGEIGLPPVIDLLKYDIENKSEVLRAYLNRDTGMKESERSMLELHLLCLQLENVDVERDRATGMPMTDSYGMYSFSSVGKKDVAYSGLYGLVAKTIYERTVQMGWVKDGQVEGLGNFFASARAI